MKLTELVAYLDDYLDVAAIPDWPDAFNGLQVERSGDVHSICVAVDACLTTIMEAGRRGADLLLVHHGLFWGAKAPLTGARYAKLAALVQQNVALYSSHTPLDAHPEVGNNHVLARQLGLEPGGLFGQLEGVPLGVWCDTDEHLGRFAERVDALLSTSCHVCSAGPSVIKRLGIITGGAGDWVDKARAAGCDTLLTGEGAHHTYLLAEELGCNLIYAGHYATETVGVQALALHLQRSFGLGWSFIDHPTGL